MRTFDFSPLYRSTVGFDRLFGLLDAATKAEEANGYPPYNIEIVGEDAYRVTMAVAGFSRDELGIEQRQNTLVIEGKRKPDKDEARTYLHRGIAGRSFERRFELADHVRVSGALLENGLLHVDLKREVPEEAKPRRIEIGGESKPRVVEGKTSQAA